MARDVRTSCRSLRLFGNLVVLFILCVVPVCHGDLLKYLLGGRQELLPRHTELPPFKRKLLLVMVDGCRWDYTLDRALDGFRRMEKYGVKAEYVVPIFPSNTYPNWYTMVTGLYAENHGMVQNFMYDKEKEEMFLMGPLPNGSHPHWWNKAEPIWITAEKFGIRTALYRWDGCQVEIRGMKPTYCEPYQGSRTDFDRQRMELKRQLWDAVDKFINGQSRLALVYHDSIDLAGHKYGPDSQETRREVKELDKILYELQEYLLENKLQNEVIVAVMSDHGMADMDAAKRINIQPHIDLNDIKFILDRGPFAMIQPEEGKTEKVYEALKKANIEGLKIFRKDELQEKYGFRGNKLVLPIILTTEEGYTLDKIPTDKHKTAMDVAAAGEHGFDPYQIKDMAAIFYARGPGLKRGYVSPPISMVDHYNLLCHLIGLDPLPNNGTWSKVRDMLGGEPELTAFDWISTVVIIFAVITAALFVSYKVVSQLNRHRSESLFKVD